MRRSRTGHLLTVVQQARTSWLRHLLLGLSLVALTVGIVGMHQLSVGHHVATGQAVHRAHLEPAAAGPGAATSPGSVSTGVALADLHGLAPFAAAGADASHEGCSTCDDHGTALGSCLLALTLLAFSWFLRPPQLRHLPPFLLPRLAPAAVWRALNRLVPPLSLTELSLRRT